MRRETRDDILRGFLAINAMLREKVKGIQNELHEIKYNPRWREQPRSPRGASNGGQWVGSGFGAAAQSGTPVAASVPVNGRATPINSYGESIDTNGVPTPGWAEPEWEYPAFPLTSDDGEHVAMSQCRKQRS